MKVVVTSSKRMRPPKRMVMLLTASIALDYTVEIAEREIGRKFVARAGVLVCRTRGLYFVAIGFRLIYDVDWNQE